MMGDISPETCRVQN